VVVVGAGNSGLQIADELADDHDVTLAVGAQSLANSPNGSWAGTCSGG
jgi:cation diffusion facilitator CzcD-associated flavoprotein CzcO